MTVLGAVSKRIAFAVLAGFLLAQPTQIFAQNTMPNMTNMPGMGQIEQVELTTQTAKDAIDGYIAMKEQYGNDNMPSLDPNTPAAAIQGMQYYQQMNAVVSQYGFEDVEDWHLALRSVIMAHSFLDEGRIEKYEQSLAQMQQQNLPEPMGSQMLAMLQSLKPSDNNLAVMAELVADSEYGPKLMSARD